MSEKTITFKDMNFKKKAEHIWEYYKLHIFGTIGIILVICFLINNYILNPQKGIYSGVAFVGTFVSDNKIEYLHDTISSELVPENENLEVRFNTFYEMESDIMIGIELGKKFETMIMSKEIDVIIASEADFKSLVYQGYIIDLNENFDNTFIKNYKNPNDILYSDNAQDKSQKPYGVRLGDVKYLKIIPDIDWDNMYIGIVRHNERNENAVNTMLKLLEK